MLHFVTATRCTSESDFLESTLTGRSLDRLRKAFPIRISVGFASSDGLSAVYNAGIEASAIDDVLVFLHDDVQIDDWLIGVRLEEALRHFDVVGVAGNRSREPFQATWYGMVEQLPTGRFVARRTGQPCGAIGHLDGGLDVWSCEPAACKLMDGVFLAARRRRLDEVGIRFDTRFKYHFYDQDFCRQCEQKGLAMGVWPIALTHKSAGHADEHWVQAREAYFDKWGD